jgi:hypothetical protein
MKHNYMISSKYCQNWSATNAAREFFANMIDSGDEHLKWEWGNGIGYVHNMVTCLKPENLLLGESGSREKADTIGQFGEGLKIGALVLARMGRKVSAISNHQEYCFTMEKLSDFNGVQTLAVEILPTQHDFSGTMVTWQCEEDEFEDARKLFLSLQTADEHGPVLFAHDSAGEILEESGTIYINGVKVQTNFDLLFGYNIRSKELLNRDRSIVDWPNVSSKIEDLLERCTDPETIEWLIKNQLLRAAAPVAYRELEMSLWPKPDARPIWESILARLYGDKVCLSSGVASADARAEYLGFKVIDMGRYAFGCENALSLKKSTAVNLEKISRTVKLSDHNKRVWNRAIKAYKLYSGLPTPIDGFAVTDELDDEHLGRRQDNRIFVSEKILEKGVAKVFMVMCHEGAHMDSHAGDCSAAFEASLNRVIESIAKVKIFKEE